MFDARSVKRLVILLAVLAAGGIAVPSMAQMGGSIERSIVRQCGPERDAIGARPAEGHRCQQDREGRHQGQIGAGAGVGAEGTQGIQKTRFRRPTAGDAQSERCGRRPANNAMCRTRS